MTALPEASPRRRGLTLRIGLAVAAIVLLAAVAAVQTGVAAIKPLYVFSGAFVGLLVGLTGVGGGSLMTPMLILLFGFHPNSAVGTDLIYASATKTVGTGVHAANRTVDWRLVRRMAMGSVPATVLTVVAIRLLHLEGDKAARPLSIALAVVLALTAGSLLLRERLEALAKARRPERPERMTAALTVALGALLGVLITLTSVGAGALGVTLLVFLYPRMPLARIVGSDIVHAVPLTLIAGMAHWWMGAVDLKLLASLLFGSAPGIIVGSLLAPRMSDKVLRPILATVLGLVALKLAT